MANNAIKEFIVSLGYKVNDGSKKAFEDAAKKAEDTVTKVAAEGTKKRDQAEDAAATQRKKKLDNRTSDDEKRDREAEKRRRERREREGKETEAWALRITGVAAKMGLAVAGAAMGIVYAMDRAAKSAEGLFYASQRSGTSAQSMNAFAYAASQLGSSVQEADSSLEAFGDKMKRYKGYEENVKSLGVRTRETNGQMRNMAEIASDLGDKLRTISKSGPAGYNQALVRGETFGFSDNIIRSMMDPRFKAAVDEYNRTRAKTGANDDELAKSGTSFEQSMRRLETVIDAVTTKVETAFLKNLQPQLDKLSTWVAEHGDKIADILGRIADDIIKLALAVINDLAKVDWDAVLTKIENFAKEFDTLARKYFGKDGITAVFEAFGLVLGISVITRLARILNLMRTLTALSPPVWMLRLLGISAATTGALAAGMLVASTSPLNANEPQQGGDGYTTFASGHRERQRRWDGGPAGAGLGYHARNVKKALVDKARAALGLGPSDDQGREPGSSPTGADDPLKNFIQQHESGGYNVAYGHAERGGPYAPPKPLTQMTISEILAYQHEMKAKAGTPAFPVGRAQWVESTLRGLTSGMDPNTLFSPELQEKLFDKSIAGRMGQGTSGFRLEWDSLKRVSDSDIQAAIDAHKSYTPRTAAPSSSPSPSGEVGDLAYFQATQRMLNRTPIAGDVDLIRRYRQQSTKPFAKAPEFHPDASRDKADSYSSPFHPDATRDGADHVYKAVARAVAEGSADLHQRAFAARDMRLRNMVKADDDMTRRRLGEAPAVYNTSTSTASHRGATIINHSPVFNLNSPNLPGHLNQIKGAASRGHQDLLRNMQAAEQ